jgi:hypothetical protein
MALPEKIVQRRLPVLDVDNTVGQPDATQAAPHDLGMCLVILDKKNY